MKDEARSHARS